MASLRKVAREAFSFSRPDTQKNTAHTRIKNKKKFSVKENIDIFAHPKKHNREDEGIFVTISPFSSPLTVLANLGMVLVPRYLVLDYNPN